METVTGYVTGINGNLANVSFDGAVHKNEVAYKMCIRDRELSVARFITMYHSFRRIRLQRISMSEP